MKKLNIGCGKNIREGYINLDLVESPGVDIVHDLNRFPYPFEANSFSELYVDNVLEHLNDIIPVMEEFHRILSPGGKLIVLVPYFSSTGAFRDPTHRHFFTSETMDYFTEGSDYNFYTKVRFKMRKKKMIFLARFMLLQWLFNKYPKFYESGCLPYLIPALFIDFELEAVK